MLILDWGFTGFKSMKFGFVNYLLNVMLQNYHIHAKMIK